MPAEQSRPEAVWTIPVHGDGRRADRQEWSRGWHGAGVAPAVPGWVRDVRTGALDPFDYHAQVAVAAEHGGFDGIAVPYDIGGEESWVLASVLVGQTRHVAIHLEFPLGVTTPVYAAKMSATFQRISGDRLGWKLAIDTDPARARAQGDFLDPARRYQRAEEFITAARGVWSQQEFSFDGVHYQVYKGGFTGPLAGHRFPRVFSSGTSKEALAFAAKHADVHLFTLGEAPEVPPEAATLTSLASAAGRRVTIGLRLPIIAREDDDEAWARADRLLSQLPSAPPASSSPLAERRDDSLWTGFGRLGYDAGVGLVGGYETVASRLRQLAASGVGLFELDANPHVEEAYRLGEHFLYRIDPAAAVSARGA